MTPLFTLLVGAFRSPVGEPHSDSESGGARSDAAMLRPAKRTVRRSVRELLALVLAHLEDAERERLTKRVMSLLKPNGDPLAAILTGLLGEAGQLPTHRGLLQVTRTTVDGIDGQARELAASASLEPPHSWEWTGHPDWTSAQVVVALGKWLSMHGFALLHLNAGRDAYHVAIVPSVLADHASSIAAAAGLHVELLDDFRKRHCP